MGSGKMLIPKLGDKIRIINGGVFLGGFLEPMTEGIIRSITGIELNLYQVEIAGKLYILAPAEFEVVK